MTFDGDDHESDGGYQDDDPPARRRNRHPKGGLRAGRAGRIFERLVQVHDRLDSRYDDINSGKASTRAMAKEHDPTVGRALLSSRFLFQIGDRAFAHVLRHRLAQIGPMLWLQVDTLPEHLETTTLPGKLARA